MGETCGYASCPLIQKDVLNVHIVPHTHGELGDTRTFYEHYTGRKYDTIYAKSQINMKRILDFTISELWANTERKFTLSDIPYFFHWWSNRDETVRRMVYTLLRQGRLYLVGGGWSMSDEATTSYHAVIDHYTYSLRKINTTFLECGRPLVAWQADCFGHSREFASLLSQMGFDGLFINPISFDDELERMKRKGLEFMWRGSDDLGADTDIFTHKLFDGYWSPPGFCFGGQCSDPLIISSTDDFNNVVERVNLFIKSVKYRQAPYYTTNNVMVIMGQRWGYYDASIWFANIDKLMTHVNRFNMAGGHNINAFYSTPACYLKAVYEENPKLQSKQDDFFPYAYDKNSYATGLYTSRPSLKYLAREGHRYLQITKQLHVIARLGNYDQFFEDMSWINGVFQDHNIISGALRPHVVDYYTTKMAKQINFALGLIKDGFNKLRKSPTDTNYFRCRFNISSCMHSTSNHFFIVVYNPLAWNVSMAVRLPIHPLVYSVYDPRGKSIKAASIVVPKHITSHPGRRSLGRHELVFYAEDIPPMGFRSYVIQKTDEGWERPKRSLIKKINQNKPKKYLVRQANSGNPNEVLFDENDTEFAESAEDEATTPRLAKIVFGNVSTNDYKSLFADVLTPKSRIDNAPTTTSTTASTTSTTERATRTPAANFPPPTLTTSRTTTTTTPPTRTSSTTARTQSTTKLEKTTTVRVTTTMKKFRTVSDSEDDDFVNFDKDLNKFIIPKGYLMRKSAKPYFNNKYIRVNLDEKKRIHNVLLANGIKMALEIKFFYYVADDPRSQANKERNPPGAYLFRTMDKQQEEIKDKFNATIFKTRLHKEYHCKLSDYASYMVKLYANSSVLEVDWVVGPIPIEDGLGKDVFIKYVTNLENKGVFYTDANGRQTIKRIRNTRPTFQPLNADQIAGNFYPVTSKIYIEDPVQNIRFSVFNDRAQGGSSLNDGEIDIMVHRRILTDDTGVQAYLNETEFNKGIMVRGTHYLYISKADNKPTRVFEKKLAKEIELKPQIFVSSYGRLNKRIWSGHNNEFTALNSKLPIGVHILSLETWSADTLLLRLENFLEKSDAVLSGVKTVQLKGLFRNLDIKEVKETTLAGNMWLKDYVPLGWDKDKFLRSFNEAYGSGAYEYTESKHRKIEEVDLNKGIVLKPQQIRTFIAKYQFVH
ncbi:hypothetical protein ABMA27_012445 [Loxostege sticticalis]|uniref:Alpha-mannosidase n=1 Tax=Loxostege sticticalis TaxID=481309 RepID=A0ABR3H1C0_LOXSC